MSCKTEKDQAAMDSEEEEDEDYVPTKEEDDDEGANNDEAMADAAVSTDSHSRLSLQQQRNVDDAFAELFGPKTVAIGGNKKKSKIPRRGRRRGTAKQRHILSDIFGASQAAAMISKSTSSSPQRVVKSYRTKVTRASGVNNTHAKISKEQILKAAAAVTSAGGMTEVKKKFAGQEVTILQQQQHQESCPSNNSENGTAAAATPGPVAPKQGLDNLLKQVEGPLEKITTVAKTSADWDQFKKTESGLGEELESQAQSKKAYLVKQDFLKRVDVRQFEREKADRDLKRAAQLKK